MKTFKNLRGELQGSSVANIPYDELNMDDVAHDASKKVSEDDGPHVSKLTGNEISHFKTVNNPENYVNQPTSKGNVDQMQPLAKRQTGKPFKSLRKTMGYGVEDLTGAVAGIAMGESVDEGEYDYEGSMAKSQLRTIIRNAQALHDMLSDDQNLPEWVQSKLVLAEDYILSATNYMQSEQK